MARSQTASENELLAMFARMLRPSGRAKGVVVGVGDDAAVIDPPRDTHLLITTDGQVEGRHFRRAWLTGFDLGWRLAAVNLSDVAAMGGRPLCAVMALNLPPGLSTRYIREIERGARDHLDLFGAPLVGGNVAATRRFIVCDLTLLGVCDKGRAWRRDCREGDAVVVAGNLGDARAGLTLLERGHKGRTALTGAFKRPTPLLEVARLLRHERAVHGAIDVSDGFSTDLIRLCRAGRTGCEIDVSLLPVSAALSRFCKARGERPDSWALRGGEDYALILSVEPTRADAIARRIERRLGVVTRVVGRFTRSQGRYRLQNRGRDVRLEPAGWDHFRA